MREKPYDMIKPTEFVSSRDTHLLATFRHQIRPVGYHIMGSTCMYARPALSLHIMLSITYPFIFHFFWSLSCVCFRFSVFSRGHGFGAKSSFLILVGFSAESIIIIKTLSPSIIIPFSISGLCFAGWEPLYMLKYSSYCLAVNKTL